MVIRTPKEPRVNTKQVGAENRKMRGMSSQSPPLVPLSSIGEKERKGSERGRKEGEEGKRHIPSLNPTQSKLNYNSQRTEQLEKLFAKQRSRAFGAIEGASERATIVETQHGSSRVKGKHQSGFGFQPRSMLDTILFSPCLARIDERLQTPDSG